MLVALAACGGGPRAPLRDALARRDVPDALAAYDSFREMDGADVDLLARIAALVLEIEAASGDLRRRDAALTQLRLAGNAGVPSLRRLADSDDDPLLQARALSALFRRGDAHARAHLYGLLDSDDSAIVAAAIPTIDASEETRRLLRYLRDTDPVVRRVAALTLADAVESLEAMNALAQAARVDPDARVRAAAARALGSFGAAAVPFLRERLGDAEAQVRLTVVGALLRADRTAAVELLVPLLATPTSRTGIEAARWIALTTPAASPDRNRAARQRADDARLYLLGALHDDDPTLRAQAAVALVSLPADEATTRGLREALVDETEPTVKLGIARALQGRDSNDQLARAALVELLAGSGMPAVQAASILAKGGHEGARRRLERALAADDAVLRRVAARALANSAGRPDDVRALLRDDDALVRIYSAGGILAAANH